MFKLAHIITGKIAPGKHRYLSNLYSIFEVSSPARTYVTPIVWATGKVNVVSTIRYDIFT